MNSAGLCDICGDAAKQLLTCPLCGRRVCPNDITVGGICRECLQGRKVDSVPDDLLDRLP
ncbi:MAG: hypothetical protein V1921_03790 [Candidatus Altiarchaeota archaeon]